MYDTRYLHVYDSRYFCTYMFMIQDTFIHFSAFTGLIYYLQYYLLQGMLCVAYFETEFGHVPLFVQFQRMFW